MLLSYGALDDAVRPFECVSKSLRTELEITFLCQCHSRSIPEGVLVEYGDTPSPASSPATSSPDSELRLAMELSARAQAEEERMRKQEEEELERILQLSLTEK